MSERVESEAQCGFGDDSDCRLLRDSRSVGREQKAAAERFVLLGQGAMESRQSCRYLIWSTGREKRLQRQTSTGTDAGGASSGGKEVTQGRGRG